MDGLGGWAKAGEEFGKSPEMQALQKLRAEAEMKRSGQVKIGMPTAEAAAAKIVKGRAARKAAKINRAKSEGVNFMDAKYAAMKAKSEAFEAAKIAKARAEEAEEAAKMAKAKAEAAEEAAKIAKVKAEEAAKAKEIADEAARLKDKETEWAQSEAELFASKFRRYWNELFARNGTTFHQTTSIPAMCYTYPTPDDEYNTTTLETLQIISVKVASIKDSLHWPLQVFGIVAARDVLDHKRNIIFQRSRNNCQTISQDDPYLALTGPSRAVALSVDPSHVEVSLKVKGTTKSEDKDLSELVLLLRSGCRLSGVYPSRLSALEFKFGPIQNSVEATIQIKVSVGSWPDGFRGVFSAVTSGNYDWKVKLLDFGDDGLPVDADGMIKLSRSVVSVGLYDEILKVSVVACPVEEEQVGEISEIALKPDSAGISAPGVELKVASCSMEVSVAWSLFCC